MPVKTIQFIYTMHNKILKIGSSTLKYKKKYIALSATFAERAKL